MYTEALWVDFCSWQPDTIASDVNFNYIAVKIITMCVEVGFQNNLGSKKAWTSSYEIIFI